VTIDIVKPLSADKMNFKLELMFWIIQYGIWVL